MSKLALIVLLAAAAPVGAQSASGTPVEKRFGNIDSVDISFDSATVPRQGRCKSNCVPRVPSLVHSGIGQATLILAFVIDAAGRVERPTMSVVQDGPTPEFRQAMCDLAARATYTFPSDMVPRRTLVLVPITMTIDQKPLPVNVKPIVDELRNTPRVELFQQLNALGHCR